MVAMANLKMLTISLPGEAAVSRKSFKENILEISGSIRKVSVCSCAAVRQVWGWPSVLVGLPNLLSKRGSVGLVRALADDTKASHLRKSRSTYSKLLLECAEGGLCDRAEELIAEMIENGVKPNAGNYTSLMAAYAKKGFYNKMANVFNSMKTYQASQPECAPTKATYALLVQAYSKGGLLRKVEKTLQEMISKEMRPDSASINAMIQAYAEAGKVENMEAALPLMTGRKFVCELETVRAVGTAYIRRSYFYQLGQFAKYLGLKAPDMGNLVGNFLLLGHAANFSMPSLAKDYVSLVESGFEPDLTTFNIRALSFSRMQMFWDLRITILDMQHLEIDPDLVTYGAIVDAYINGDLHHKLLEALRETRNIHAQAEVRTDSYVFQAFGKGDFHVCCEGLLLNGGHEHITYANLVEYYLHKYKDSQ